MQNLVHREVSLETFAKLNAKHPYFKLGYESIIKNLPYDYSIVDQNCAVKYARGRMFAIWCKDNKAPRAVWRGAVPAKTLVERVARAAMTRGIFV